MPSFLDIKKGGWEMKGMVISFVVALVGGSLAVYRLISPQSSKLSEDVVLMCMNPDCDYVGHMTQDEFWAAGRAREEEWMAQNPEIQPDAIPGMPPGFMTARPPGMEGMPLLQWGTAQLPLRCPQCNMDSLIRALECPKCGEVYLADSSKEFPDECPNPECGYSRVREKREAQRAEKVKAAKERSSRRKKRK